jgi:tetratricopeptide (TPR) repeat protein
MTYSAVQQIERKLKGQVKFMRQLLKKHGNSGFTLQGENQFIGEIWSASLVAVKYPEFYPLIVELFELARVPIHLQGAWEDIKYNYEAVGVPAALGSNQLRLAAKFLTYIGVIKSNQDDPLGALQYFDRAVGLFRQLSDDPKAQEDLVSTLFHKCVAHNDLGEYRTVLQIAREAASTARDLGRWDTEAWALGQLGNANVRLGNLAQAELLYLKCEKIWKSHPEQGHYIHTTYYHLGRLCILRADYNRAYDYLAQSLRIKKEQGELKEGFAHCAIQLGIACAHLGPERCKEAVDYLNQAIEIVETSLGDKRGIAEARYGYALVSAKTGNINDAIHQAKLGLSELDGGVFPDVQVQLMMLLAKLILRSGKIQHIRPLIKKAVAVAQGRRFSFRVARLLFMKGSISR